MLLRRRARQDLEVRRERHQNRAQLVEARAVAVELRLAGLDQIVERRLSHHHSIEVGTVHRDGEVRVLRLEAL